MRKKVRHLPGKICPVKGSTKYGPGGVDAVRGTPPYESDVITIEVLLPAGRLAEGGPEPLKAR